jgi:uncharacterized Fe-S cluster-containing radical SAM superfamily protein
MSSVSLREFHPFEAAGRRFLYLVPSAAVFALDDCSSAVLDSLSNGPRQVDDLTRELSSRFDSVEVGDTIAELARVRALGESTAKPMPVPKVIPLKPVPLQTLVVNVTNQCNLACTYCYEYGEDKIVDTENGKQPKFMSEATARDAVEFALRESRDNPRAHITFFGGETLMNFPVLKSTIAYARQRAAEVGKDIDFSLTTNATLLRPDVIEFLATERVGVTISIDGPEEMQDKFRVFNNGTGSYAIAAPKIKALLARHRSRARHSDEANPGRPQDLSAPHRGAWLLGSRVRAGHDGAGPRLRDFRRRLRSPARAVPRSRRRLPRGGAAESPSRLLEHPRDASRAPPRTCEGVSVRRGSRLDGRLHRWPGRALSSLRRLRGSQPR